MAQKISAVKGMNDIFFPQSDQWEGIENLLKEQVKRYGYQAIKTPIVESTALFTRGIGEITDIVEKEMYSFEDKLNGEALTLRPEATASVVRAAIEHNSLYDGPRRWYYTGPMFRHERPQRGRYRQFHQFGVEALGFSGPELDAEIMIMAAGIWAALGLKDIELHINCLGQVNERALYREQLKAYFLKHHDQLDQDSQRRVHTNPLRILDSKNPQMQALIQNAPELMQYLGAESKAHLQALESILQANAVPYQLNPRLVRGLDYYNLTVFEFITTQLGSQGTICAGGRYDGLFEQIGGKPSPAVGWALGLERLLELLNEQKCLPQGSQPDVYVVKSEGVSFAWVMQACQLLRQQGCHVLMHASTLQGAGSLKSQFKRAHASRAQFVMICAEQEVEKGAVSIKSMYADEESASQVEVPLDQLPLWWAQNKT